MSFHSTSNGGGCTRRNSICSFRLFSTAAAFSTDRVGRGGVRESAMSGEWSVCCESVCGSMCVSAQLDSTRGSWQLAACVNGRLWQLCYLSCQMFGSLTAFDGSRGRRWWGGKQKCRRYTQCSRQRLNGFAPADLLHCLPAWLPGCMATSSVQLPQALTRPLLMPLRLSSCLCLCPCLRFGIPLCLSPSLSLSLCAAVIAGRMQIKPKQNASSAPGSQTWL